MRKRSSMPVREPYNLSPAVKTYDTFTFGSEVVSPGAIIRFRNVRGTFKFIRFARNEEKGTSWIDCMSVKSGSFHSFPESSFSRTIKPRKYRTKVAKI
jgi:hypothetical protein